MDAKYEKIYRECETYFDKNYPNAELSEKNWYTKGALDVIMRLSDK